MLKRLFAIACIKINLNIFFVILCRFDSMHDTIKAQATKNTFIICSGSVSMGDKDFLKTALNKLGFETHFGRVNMKPGLVFYFNCISIELNPRYSFSNHSNCSFVPENQ